jgi:hypothetical protein
VQDVPHEYHVGVREVLLKEVARLKREPVCDARRRDVFLKHRRHFRQVESHPPQVWAGQSNLRREISLGRAYVDERAVIHPREHAGDVRLAPWLMPVIATRNCFRRLRSA